MSGISMQDVAEQLQISRVTVSKVVNNQPGVAIKTRKRVLQSLLDNGYKKINQDFLQILEPQKEKSIAVVVTEPHFSTFWIEIINGIASFLDKKGFHLVYQFLDREKEKQHKIPSQLSKGDLHGLITLNIYDVKTIKKLEELGIPSIFLDVNPETAKHPLRGDLLLIEGHKSLFAITQMLIDQGLQRIGFIGDIHYAESIRHRWTGFESALQANKLALEPEYCLLRDDLSHFYTQETLFAALNKIKQQPQAWVCANDFIAFIVIQYLQKQDLKIPGDIAITGFDHIRNPMINSFSLTSVHVDARYIGYRLAQQFLMRLQFPQMPFEVVHIEPEIILGASTIS